MSTTTAARSLLAGLVDDAAVFPPGNAPVERAWAEHLELRAGPYAELLGSLLVAASDAEELERVASALPAPEHVAPVAVSVVARAGVPAEALVGAVERLRGVTGVQVVGAGVAHDASGGWGTALGLGVRTAVEVPREGMPLARALDELAEAAASGSVVVAKLRTQATPAQPAPTPRQVAEFFTAAAERGLPFKLTGGLHHPAAHGDVEDGTFEHGFLNVLVAAQHLRGGAGLPSLTATLEMTDAEALAALAGALPEQEAADLRAAFTGFGCCGVLDPAGALAHLGLLPHTDQT